MRALTQQRGLFAVRSVDLFAGGGGASEGIRLATGQAPLVAVNHDPDAIRMHADNHPGTLHLCESVWDVEPFLPHGQPLDLLWASPNCTHFSRAKGGKPLDDKPRALANVVVTWARAVRPRVIGLENVPEFLDWGPLDANGRPIKARKGETFRRWCRDLEAAGYVVEWRVLTCSDYGAPTTRKRLFLVARCDGQQIRWPEPTHGPGRAASYRTAAECIDWSQPMLSIFATPDEAKAFAREHGCGRPRRPLAEKTQARIAEGVRRFVLEAAEPFVLTIDHRSNSDRAATAAAEQPLSTITTKARHAVVAPYLINTRNGERPGQRPRTRDLRRPLNTITAQGSQGALVAAFLAKHYGGVTGHGLRRPLGTVTVRDHHSLVSAHLTPHPTADRGQRVAAWLMKYYGQGVGQPVDEPLHTIPTRDRFGLVTVELGGEEYAITDIGMRMLTPRELARAQGFDDDYRLTGTKTAQIARIGNSVPPQVVAAVVGAQFPHRQLPQPMEVAA